MLGESHVFRNDSNAEREFSSLYVQIFTNNLFAIANSSYHLWKKKSSCLQNVFGLRVYNPLVGLLCCHDQEGWNSMIYQIWWQNNDVVPWKHFPHYQPFVLGIHWWPQKVSYAELYVLFVASFNKQLNKPSSCRWRHHWKYWRSGQTFKVRYISGHVLRKLHSYQSQSGVPQITLSCYKALSQQKY